MSTRKTDTTKNSQKTDTTAPARDDVGRAAGRLRQVTDELVDLMGQPDGDSPVDMRAAQVLVGLRHCAVEPPAAGLGRARRPVHRGLILMMIKAMVTEPVPAVIEILARVARKDPDPSVRALAQDAISAMATLEMAERLGVGARPVALMDPLLEGALASRAGSGRLGPVEGKPAGG